MGWLVSNAASVVAFYLFYYFLVEQKKNLRPLSKYIFFNSQINFFFFIIKLHQVLLDFFSFVFCLRKLFFSEK